MSAYPEERVAWEQQVERLRQERPTPLRDAWYLLSRNKLALVGSLLALFFALVGLFAPMLEPHSPARQDLFNTFERPFHSWHHVLGTDQLGRDVFSRLLEGIRISMGVGLLTTLAVLVVGTVAGMVAGYYRGWIDTVINGFVEMVWGFPLILVAVIIAGAIGPGLTAVIAAVAFINWAGFARIVRGEVLALREKEFVAGARALGKGDVEIMVKHLLPNVIGSALVMGSYYVAVAIIVEAGLSFIGLGAQPPTASLGQMVADGRNYLQLDHWIATVPGITIVLVVLSLNLLGDGLRDVLDPRLKRER
ncbi:MAG: ABC transporter permease [Actinobacteria bacterium]|nr:MAG: ABC transporter permease [Actinomycetota bacterium]